MRKFTPWHIPFALMMSEISCVRCPTQPHLRSLPSRLSVRASPWPGGRQRSSRVMTTGCFASPARLGRQPWSDDQVWRSFPSAAAAAGIGRLGTHSMRHTYRSWLDAAGKTVAVLQKLMRQGGHPHHHEPVRGCGPKRDARGPFQGGSDGSAEAELICK